MSGPSLGSLDWGDATQGRLTTAQRRAFLGPSLREAGRYVADRVRLALGLRRADAAGLDLDAFALPGSRLVREAETEARETLTPSMLAHSQRTFFYGLALARLDRTPVDVEHFYATSLLHDIALETPEPGACFAVRGGRTMEAVALRAGLDAATARRLGDAIAHHITPGVGPELGPLAPLLQLGAMVDLTGRRLWELRPDFVSAVLARHPRQQMKRHLGGCWRAEAETVRGGRAAFAERVFRFSLLVGLAPYAD